jgi:asparagine synthase (glutamine-hydrolysing)
MSAIAGAVHSDGREMSDALLAGIIAAAAKRGDDGFTSWRDGPAGMIRFAHAATPEAVGEVQPFRGEGSGIAVLFDGRLDNRPELIDLLSRPQLASAPDGEIVLALYEALGRDFVHKLAGDFAIAIWEPRARRMSLFRSALGWRPLVWTFDGRTFAFATEPRGLIVGLGLERKYNEGALGEYLAARFISETETFWSGIERVPQGAATIFENGRVSTWAWHGGPYEDLFDLSMEEHVERFNALFDQALTSVSRSTGPVTSQLSGGLDSSSIVCRGAELYRAGKLERPIGAISARFPGKPHDETKWSSAVEEHSGVPAEVVSAYPFSLEEARQWCADTYLMPIRPNALDTMASTCAALQSNGRRVLLTGEGGDDWLNGSFGHWPGLLTSGRWISLFRHGAEQWPDSRWDVIARRTLYPAVMPLISRRHHRSLLKPHLDYRLSAPDWLRSEWMEKIGLEERWKQSIPREGLHGLSQKSRYSVFTHAGRHAIAEPAMAYAEMRGIEVRHPFHDIRLTRFYMGASGNHLRRYNCRKVLLREAMKGTLPELVRTRTTKAFFVSHTLAAIEGIFRERPPHAMLPAKLGWIDPDKILALNAPFVKWREEGSSGPLPKTAWGPVWFTVAADMWLQNAFGL